MLSYLQSLQSISREGILQQDSKEIQHCSDVGTACSFRSPAWRKCEGGQGAATAAKLSARHWSDLGKDFPVWGWQGWEGAEVPHVPAVVLGTLPTLQTLQNTPQTVEVVKGMTGTKV